MSNLTHDTLFKRLLQNHFTDFLTAFFPQIANELDFTDFSPENFLNQEQLPEVDGKVYQLDIVARVKLKHGKSAKHLKHQKFSDTQDSKPADSTHKDAFVIVFVEAQHKRHKDFQERVFRYFYLLHLKYKTTIIPLVIYSDKAKWRDENEWTDYKMKFAGLTFVHFQFYALKLSMKKTKDYLRSSNPAEVALAALMDLNKKDLFNFKFELLKRLQHLKITEEQQANLYDFIDSYLEVDGKDKQKELNSKKEAAEKGEIMVIEHYTKLGIEQGIEKGIEMGQTMNKMNTVSALLKKGMDWDFIQDVTTVNEEKYNKWLADSE